MRSTSPEVLALRYATDRHRTKSGAYYKHQVYGEPDLNIGMDFYFWLIRSQGQTVLVDCGFSEEAGAQHNLSFRSTPSDLLSRMGVDPRSVDHVVLSHMHFDHVGNTHLFPNSTFHMARAEYDFWTGPYRNVPAVAFPVVGSEVRLIESLRQDQRLELLGDSGELGTSGVRVTRYPGHTPGQLVAEVVVDQRRVVLASDAAHYYDEFRQSRPFYVFTDIVQMLHSYDALRELDALPHVDVIPGHDPEVAKRYVEVAKDCFDLTRPLHDDVYE